MKSKIPTISTIRFRRWSRKNYATFASIGRCVTIGCLRKDVADSSLAKQKATGAATYTECGTGSAWQGFTQRKEDDYSALSEIEFFLFCGMPQQVRVLNVFSGAQGVSLIKKREVDFPTQISNSIGTVYQNQYDLCKSSHSDKPCFY